MMRKAIAAYITALTLMLTSCGNINTIKQREEKTTGTLAVSAEEKQTSNENESRAEQTSAKEETSSGTLSANSSESTDNKQDSNASESDAEMLERLFIMPKNHTPWQKTYYEFLQGDKLLGLRGACVVDLNGDYIPDLVTERVDESKNRVIFTLYYYADGSIKTFSSDYDSTNGGVHFNGEGECRILFLHDNNNDFAYCSDYTWNGSEFVESFSLRLDEKRNGSYSNGKIKIEASGIFDEVNRTMYFMESESDRIKYLDNFGNFSPYEKLVEYINSELMNELPIDLPSNPTDWQQAYYDAFVRDKVISNYCVRVEDITGDGIPDVIFRKYREQSYCSVYYYHKGKVKRLDISYVSDWGSVSYDAESNKFNNVIFYGHTTGTWGAYESCEYVWNDDDGYVRKNYYNHTPDGFNPIEGVSMELGKEYLDGVEITDEMREEMKKESELEETRVKNYTASSCKEVVRANQYDYSDRNLELYDTAKLSAYLEKTLFCEQKLALPDNPTAWQRAYYDFFSAVDVLDAERMYIGDITEDDIPDVIVRN